VHYASLSLEPFVQQGIVISSVALDVKDVQYTSDSVSVGVLDLKVDSNVTDLILNAKIKENHLTGQLRLTPTKELFELYDLPIRKEAIGDIVINVTASEEQVVADLSKEMKQLLKSKKGDFNLDIDSLQSHVVYDINEGSMKADSKVMLSTPYAKNVLVTNLFTMDDNISYSGEIHVKQIIGVDAKFVKPLNNLEVKYEGDIQSIKTDILSDNLQGTFTSSDFKKAQLHLETKEALVLNQFIELPLELNQTKANVVIDVPIRFDENVSLVAYTKINSNVLNVDANISYEDTLRVKTVSYIPEESLLRTYSEELKWDRLSPIRAEAELKDDAIDAVLTAGSLAAKAHYDLESTKVDGKMSLGGLHADISGIAKQKLNIYTKINSMSSLIESVKDIYTFADVPIVKGSADISVELSDLKTVDIVLKSPEILYQPDHKTEHYVNDIDLAIKFEDSKVVLNRYTLTYATQKLFSTKPSTISLADDIVTISPLWINDQLEVAGEYNIRTKKGTIDTEAKKLHIEHEIVDLDSMIDIKTVLDGNKTYVNGDIVLLGGNIHYDLNQKSFASDSDIIIVQDMKVKKESSFIDNLSVAVQIKTKKPLIFKKDDIDIQAKVEATVYKADHGDLMLLGMLEILEGGSYNFKGKKFVFDKSHIYFTGNPTKPILDASATYKAAIHYITISVTGTADTPHINFSSIPNLSREQILSVLLFDSPARAGTNSGDDMMRMMGGAMAKSVLSTIGIELDHLVVGDDNSVEVGSKLTDKILITYINDIVPKVELRYLHAKHTESVIRVGGESQSYDIIYTSDF